MPASFVRITIDGQPLDSFSEGAILENVEIRQQLNHHWWCDIEIRQTEDKRFPFEDAIGKPLKIFSIADDGSESTVFTGFVLESELDYEVFGSFTARLVGVTLSYKLDLTPRSRYYFKKSFSDVAKTLIGEAGLAAEGIFNAEQTLSYVQYGETDFEFLNRLADDSESWLRPTETGIEAGNAFQTGVTLEWRAEHGLTRFTARGKLSQPSLDGAHYDFREMESKLFKKVKDKAEFFGSMTKLADAAVKQSDQLPPDFIVQRSRVRSQDEYEKLLKKECRRSMGRTVECHGLSRKPGVKPGDEVTIQGVLDAKGTYGLTKVIHAWGPDGYTNQFWCTLAKRYTNPQAPAVKPWFGVVPARVVDNKDPFDMNTIRVQFFWQEDSQSSPMRMMTPHAGADRGMMFRPEVGDEVWVAFEDGDPERPRVLGSAWNGVDMAPMEEFWGGDIEPNDVKRIVTKSGHRITMVDKAGKETICIATPKHCKMMMTESSTETGGSTLTLHSDGDIVISAGGRIHMKSAYNSREVG